MAAKKLAVSNEPKFYTREHPELSERISIAEFKKQCETLYRQYEVMVPRDEDLAMQLQVSADIYHEVESVCKWVVTKSKFFHIVSCTFILV